MKNASLLAAALSLSAIVSAQTQKVGWSLGYYCGWDQDGGYKPAQIDWAAFTHIAHFTVFPNNDGSLDVNSNGLSDANCKAAVAEAHKNNVKIVFSIGGAQAKDRFKNACAPENIHKFVKNLLDFMRKYGYDGIDTDWEENFDDAKFLALHKELRDSLNAITPAPLLTIAGGGYFAAHCYTAHPYVDMMNTMSYDVNLAGMTQEMKEFTSRGVPKAKLGVGIGIGGGGSMVDVDSATAKGKVQFSINNGFGGIMQWAVQGSARHAQIFRMLEQYRPATASVIFSEGKLRVVNDPALMVARNTITGLQEVRYRLPAASAVDVSVFDSRGLFRESLFHGNGKAGLNSLPLNAGHGLGSGAFIVKLSQGDATRSAAVRILP
ncbi:MAG: putative chitinase [Fibrobacteres bacterium]|nr:putative chitinase [Fibrobacterota bacterium]